MADNKKPKPKNKKKPTSAGKKKPTSLNRKKPATTSKTKTAASNKKKTMSANKVKLQRTGRKKREQVQSSAPKARMNGKEVLRRVLIVLLALLIVFGVVLSAYSVRGERIQKKITLRYSGVLQSECIFSIGFEDEQVSASVRATKRYGQTKAFTYFCNSTLQLSPVSMKGFIQFGNPADNDCSLVLSIFDKNGKMIYRSGGVEPGKYITQIPLSVNWESGEYACTAYVSAYADKEHDYKCIGVQYSRLTVKVGETS